MGFCTIRSSGMLQTNETTSTAGELRTDLASPTYETVKVAADAIGPERVGYRMSLESAFWGMRMEDRTPYITDVINKLKEIVIGHVRLIESRMCGDSLVDSAETLDFAYDNWKVPILINRGYTPDTVRRLVDEHPDRQIIVTFGRSFTANPDLVYKAKHGLTLNHYDRPTFIHKTPRAT